MHKKASGDFHCNCDLFSKADLYFPLLQALNAYQGSLSLPVRSQSGFLHYGNHVLHYP
jgi:hypothetical protein